MHYLEATGYPNYSVLKIPGITIRDTLRIFAGLLIFKKKSKLKKNERRKDDDN